MEEEKKYLGGWVVWLFSLAVAAALVLTALSYMGVIGRTIVERKVFENSYQYHAATKSQIAIFEAQLAEISRKLSNTNLTANTRANLEASASSIRVQLSAARSK